FLRSRLPRGLGVQAVDEALEPGSGHADGADDGTQAQSLGEQPADEGVFFFEDGPLRGLVTKWRPQERQRKVGVPAELGPLRTTWVAVQRRQGGIGVSSGVVVFIPSVYYAAQGATTRTSWCGVGAIMVG